MWFCIHPDAIKFLFTFSLTCLEWSLKYFHYAHCKFCNILDFGCLHVGLDRPPPHTHTHLRGEIGRSWGSGNWITPAESPIEKYFIQKLNIVLTKVKWKKDGVQPSIHMWDSTFSQHTQIRDAVDNFFVFMFVDSKQEDRRFWTEWQQTFLIFKLLLIYFYLHLWFVNCLRYIWTSLHFLRIINYFYVSFCPAFCQRPSC